MWTGAGRYAAQVLKHYVEMEGALQPAAPGPSHPPSPSQAAALNSEVTASTALVLHLLQAFRAFPLRQVRMTGPPTPSAD